MSTPPRNNPVIQRICVVGKLAAGKSTFARKLAAQTGLPVHHLDTIIWGPNWVPMPDAEKVAKVRAIVNTPQWIIEGWIQSDTQFLIKEADLIIHIDLPGWQGAWQVLKRWLQSFRGRRAELAEGCHDELEWKPFWYTLKGGENGEFIEYMADQPRSKIVHLRSRAQQQRFLKFI